MGLERSLVGALLTVVLAAGPVAAQDRAVSLMVRGGGDNPFTVLDDATTASLKTGYNLGAGVGLHLSPRLAVRGDVSFTRNGFRALGMRVSELSRLFMDASVQFKYPTESGWELFGSAGGGIVKLHEPGTKGQDSTKPTAALGAGMSYTFPGTNVGFSLEAKGWFYQFKDLKGSFENYDKTMIDVGWTGGLSYQLPF